ncbi:TIGR00341 family protein [Qipengyuania sp. JC766]|uniref:TIGR00341 family protein n=1 Tax=Qipengyuania sp. JC766 TaxID=3232139 RepID=UPI003458D557
MLSFNRWWHSAMVDTVEQAEVIAKRREECSMSSRYMFMTAMSGGIAILGLLLSSPAVVIGAMLLSPLMGPIMGLGFALAIGDYRWLRQSAVSLGWGSIMAIGLCAVIVFLSPLQDITQEIASRTRPNLFDLLVALFSSLAGAYAMIRGREGTIVGVAIATALMPPLAVVGFGLATFNWTVFSGALLLYITNLVTIALTAAVMARVYGFDSMLTERQSQLQNLMIGVMFVALAVPLGFSLSRIAWEARAGQQVRSELSAIFEESSRFSTPEINFDVEPLSITADVWTTEYVNDAQELAERRLARLLERPVRVELNQLLVRDEESAERAQLASANLQEEAREAQRRADNLAMRLSLAAGVSTDEVTIDRQRRRAIVRAAPLPDATMATYYALEQRIASTEQDWRIEMIPPRATLPAIPFENAEVGDGRAPTQGGTAALEIIAWAANRLGDEIEVSGPAEDRSRAIDLLGNAGVDTTASTEPSETVRARWAAPDN